MEKSVNKKRILDYVGALMFFLFAAALVVFLTDPFFHYHKPWFGLSAIQDSTQYQVPGALEHLDYDSILLGSSVTMSVNTNVLNEKYQCNTIKAVGSSASAPQLIRDLNTAMDRQELKCVFYGLDVFSFYADPSIDMEPSEVKYLTDANPFNDVKYLLNGEILLGRIPDLIKISRAGVYDEGTAYRFNYLQPCGPDVVLAQYCPTALSEAVSQKPESYEQEFVEENLASLEKVIREHPQTQFKFFLPPYSVLKWSSIYREGNLDTYMYSLKLCMEHLLAYDNVKMYKTEFNDARVITDLYQFMDYVHAGTGLTDQLAYMIGDENQEITMETYQEEVAQLIEVWSHFEERYAKEGIGFVYSGPMSMTE